MKYLIILAVLYYIAFMVILAVAVSQSLKLQNLENIHEKEITYQACFDR